MTATAYKKLLVDEIKSKLERGSFIVTQYKGLGANQANDLRSELSKTGGELEVVRKRLLVKAAESLGVELDEAALEGHIGVIVTGEDPVTTTKTVVDFGKEGALEVLLGHFEGKTCTASDVKKLSELPDKDGMRAQLLGLLEAPMSQTLATMEALLCSVVYCLDNKVKEQAPEES